MFTKENILIPDFGMFNLTRSKSNLDNQINDLCILLNQIINELKISSLSKVTIIDFYYSKTTDGRTSYNLSNNSMSSQMEFDKKVFVNFNNTGDIQLRNEALAVIYHEFYHVYNEENLFYKFGKVKIQIEESPYCSIGAKCWSEYLSYYKTKEFHMSDYPFKEFDIIYNRIKQNRPSPEIVNSFFYMITNICAYESNDQYINNLKSTTCFSEIKTDFRYINIVKKLSYIMQCYPDSISGVEVFTNLGKTYCELIKHFCYEMYFEDEKIVIE